MKKVLLAICLALTACSKPEPEHKVVIIQKHQDPPSLPAPAATNPFEHPTLPPPPPAPVSRPFQSPDIRGVGSFKLNDGANMIFLRDEANGVTCYCIDFSDGHHQMSCVKQ